MNAPVIFLGAFSILSVCLLTVAGLAPHPARSDQTKETEQARLIDTQKELIAALERKADAFEREAKAATSLAAEREKTIAMYRGIVGGDTSAWGAAGIATFGVPAEQLGGGNGRWQTDGTEHG